MHANDDVGITSIKMEGLRTMNAPPKMNTVNMNDYGLPRQLIRQNSAIRAGTGTAVSVN